MMNKKIVTFLNYIDCRSEQKLIDKMAHFLKKQNHYLLFRDGQIYFMKDDNIISFEFIDSKSNLIVKFDGKKIKRVDKEYYVGTNVKSDRENYDSSDSDSDSDIDFEFGIDLSDISNNNNNNNNNGNNGNNG